MKNKKSDKNTRSSSGSSKSVTLIITDSMKKKLLLKQIIFFLYHTIRLSLSILIIVYTLTTTLSPVLQLPLYNRIQENLNLWNKDVIIDIIAVSSYNCPEGYQPYAFTEWPGINQGCQCSTTINDYDYIHVLPGKCYGKLIDVGCTRVEERESIPFVFWRSDELLCIKRISGLNFHTDLIHISDKKMCGSGNYQYESLDQIDCPITDLQNSTTLENVLDDIGFSFSRQNNYPLIDIKVSEYLFCQEYNKSNISPNRFQNYNLEPTAITTCQQSDPRVQEIDQITEKQLFNYNQRILQTVQSLPVYPEPSDDYVYKLGTVRYPSWSFACRQSSQYSLSQAVYYLSFETLSELVQAQAYICILLIVLSGLLSSFLMIVGHIYELKSKIASNTVFLSEEQIQKINPNYKDHKILSHEVIKITLILIIGVLVVVVLGVHFNTFSQIHDWYKNAKQCTQSYFITWISSMLSQFEGVLRTLMLCILFGIVILLCDVIFLIWRFHKGDLSSLPPQSQALTQVEGVPNGRDIGDFSQKMREGEENSGREETEESLKVDDEQYISSKMATKKQRQKVKIFDYDLNDFD